MSFVDRLFPRNRPQPPVAPPATGGAPAAPGPSTVYPVGPAGGTPVPVLASEWQPAPYAGGTQTPAVVPQAPAPGSAPPAATAPAAPMQPGTTNGIPGQPQPAPPARPAPVRQDVEARRQALSRQLADLQWDLGGLTYEMAIRDHFRLDVLAKQAARLQAVDAELAEVERQLRLEDAGASGECPSCRALHSRGAVYCWSCGAQLLPTQPAGGQPPAPTA